jgi:plastocyanin
MLVVVIVGALAAAAPPAQAAGGDPPQPFSVTTDADGMQHMHFLYGPLTAAPGQNLILAGPQSVATPPEDGYIVGFRPGLVGEDLKTPPPVEQVHMHHAVFLNLSRQDVTRPELPERMFAFAEEKTQGRVPYPYGYPFKASDVLAINYMLHNETPDTRTVFITYDLDFVPAGTPLAAKMKPARPLWLDVENGKAYPVFDVHRGSGSDGRFTYGPSRSDWTVDHDGSLVVTAGHVHPGGLWTDLDLLRGDRRSHLFRSDARYFDPNGPVSWDMAMTMTPPDWKVAVNKGDKLHVSATYDTTRASWYEVMGIMLAYMVDDQNGAADPFGHRFATTGKVTHGELKEATHFGGTPTSLPDPSRTAAGQTIDSRVGIADFAYLPGDMSTFTSAGVPTVQRGQALRFGNLDASASILHTVTACRAPCTGATGVSYPLADGAVEFDSGDLGYGPSGYTAAKNAAEWTTPAGLSPGTYTYFCRIHPFMRGAFRVSGPSAAAPAGAPAAGPARVTRRTVRVRRGVARVRVACASGGGRCTGRLVARRAGRTVGVARFSVGAGRARTVVLRVRARGRVVVRLIGRGATLAR